MSWPQKINLLVFTQTFNFDSCALRIFCSCWLIWLTLIIQNSTTFNFHKCLSSKSSSNLKKMAQPRGGGFVRCKQSVWLWSTLLYNIFICFPPCSSSGRRRRWAWSRRWCRSRSWRRWSWRRWSWSRWWCRARSRRRWSWWKWYGLKRN